MVCFADGSSHSSDTDSVAAHNRVLDGTVFVHVGHVHGLGIFRAKLEDVTNLDTAGNRQGSLTAAWADAAFYHYCQICILCIRELALHVHSCVVIVHFVCTAYKVCRAL